MSKQSTPVVRELADVFHDREEAVLLLQRSDFPMSRLPDFTTPLSFWSAVAEKAYNGVLPGGIQRVIDTAARLYPDNSMFRAMGSWDASTTQRMMNSVVERRFGAQALVPRRVDTGTAKAPIGRWVAVVMGINSLLSAFSVAVLLYALPLGPPPMLEPGPQGSPSHEETSRTEDRVPVPGPDLPPRGKVSSKKKQQEWRQASKERKERRQKRKAQKRGEEEEGRGPRTDYAPRTSSVDALVCG